MFKNKLCYLFCTKLIPFLNIPASVMSLFFCNFAADFSILNLSIKLYDKEH